MGSTFFYSLVSVMSPVVSHPLPRQRQHAPAVPVVRLCQDEADIRAVMDLRQQAFRPGSDRSDRDLQDRHCEHLIVEGPNGPRAALRLREFGCREGLDGAYAASGYDLNALSRLRLRKLEIGRLCLAPDVADQPRTLHALWGGLTRLVERRRIGFVFGCLSFPGAEPERHAQTLARLHARHLAPTTWRPACRSDAPVPLSGQGGEAVPPPPLLDFYTALGGRVADHAYVDRDLGTIVLFLGLDVAAVPAPRARSLRAASQRLDEAGALRL